MSRPLTSVPRNMLVNRAVLELARILLPLLARWLVTRVNQWLLEKIDDALQVEA